jgi:hypothetical protein
MIRKMVVAGLFALCAATAGSDIATAATAYDGPWSLTFYTRRGDCDRSYNFQVYITNGIIRHPNLVRFRGRVSSGGSVNASVAVEGKYASGSGRLTRSSGRGSWSGHSESSRCSGTWVASRG